MPKSKTVKPIEGVVESGDCDQRMKAMILSVVFGNIKLEVERDPTKAIEMLDEFQVKLLEIMGIRVDEDEGKASGK